MGSEIVYSLVKCYNWALADTAQLPSTGHKLLLRGLACVYFLKNANYHHDKLNTATAYFHFNEGFPNSTLTIWTMNIVSYVVTHSTQL